MLKLKSPKVECQTCDDHGYIQLLLGGSETCMECHGSKKWSAKHVEKKLNIKPVHLK